MELFTYSILLLLMFATSVSHGAVFTDAQKRDLISFADSVRICRNIEGLTMAVVKGNDTWTRGFGKADRDANEDVDSSDVFLVGSLTKYFTAALISTLINDTGYSWQTRIVDILGSDFKFVNDELTNNATIEDMLTHRTGLDANPWPLIAGSNTSMENLAKNFRYLPTVAPFRNDYAYNNWPYALLGRVAEVMGNDSWENLIHTRLLNPMGMSSSGIIGRTVSDGTLAKSYVWRRGVSRQFNSSLYSLSHLDASAVAVASTADDMAKWLLLHVNKGWSPAGGQVLNQTLMREMANSHINLSETKRAWFTFETPPYPVTTTVEGYGYGIMNALYQGVSLLLHYGSIFGFNSFMAFLPGQNAGIFLSNNGPWTDVRFNQVLFFYLADILLGKEHWLNASTACNFPRAWVSRSSDDEDEALPVYNQSDFQNPENYAGRYTHPLFGEVNVIRDGSSKLKVKYGRLEGKLFPGSDNDSVMWELTGDMETFFNQQNETGTYGQWNFTNLSTANLYQNIIFSSFGAAMVFDRA